MRNDGAPARGLSYETDRVLDMLCLCGELDGIGPTESYSAYLRRLIDAHIAQRLEIKRLAKDRAMLIELVLEDALTPAAKNLIAIALRDGPPPPTEETLTWCKKTIARIHGELPQPKSEAVEK